MHRTPSTPAAGGNPRPPQDLPVALPVALQSVALPEVAGAEAPPEWLPLVPAGHHFGRDGRNYVADPEAVLQRFAAEAIDIPVDYEHASELRAKRGEEAPAAGWVKQLEAREGAIWGRVEWNRRAADMIREREYRFYSPALLIDHSDTPARVVGLSSVGLTNKPNFDVPALNHQQPEKAMLDAAIRQALGLKDEATADDAVAAITTLKSDRDVALHRAETPSLDKFVPRGDYAIALNRAETAEAALADERKRQADAEIGAAIDAAVEAKKITPASVEYHRAQCATEGGLERFKAFVDQATPLVGDTDLGTRQPEKSTQLNAEQAHVAKLLGKPAELFTQASQ